MATHRLPEGALLQDRYQIQEIVGRGGMGTVYRALDSRLDIEVAVKELAEQPLIDEEREGVARQFEREAKLLAQLRHPNLPRVTDYFVQESRCYLAMEFIHGDTLEARLERNPGRPLPLIDALDWAVQVSDVLTYLHDQDPAIIFRDLKPANIMITADGVAKLIDFGIARRFQAGAGKDTTLYGSPGYSPPEQYGRTQTDERSDIYSFGATLHQMVTGRDPGSAPFKFPSIRQLDPSLPQALDTLILKCVQTDIEKRTDRAIKVRDELVRIRAMVLAEEHRSAAAASGGAPRIQSARLDGIEQAETFKKIGLVVAGAAVLCIGIYAAATKLKARPSSNPPGQSSGISSKPIEDPGSGMGKLNVTSDPEGATVLIDGKEVGTTPYESGSLSVGKHVVKLLAPADSGRGTYQEEISVKSGAETMLRASLPVTTSASSAPAASVTKVTVQQVLTGPEEPEGGYKILAWVHITGAAKKNCLLSAFFYAPDGVTPLKANNSSSPYQSQDGQVAVSTSVPVESDSVDLTGTALFIPDSALPVTGDQATFRILIHVDDKQIMQSDPSPLRPGM